MHSLFNNRLQISFNPYHWTRRFPIRQYLFFDQFGVRLRIE